MQTVVNSLAVLAFLGVLLLLFANSALLKTVRDLQAAVAEQRIARGATGEGDRLVVPALADAHGPTFVLVVSARCPACEERAQSFNDLSRQGPPGRLVAISADPQCAEWFAGSEVIVHIDPALVGQVGVSVTPTLLRYDAEGRQEWRRVVGSDEDLRRLLGLVANQPTVGSTPAL